MRRIKAIALALCLVLALCVPAAAAKVAGDGVSIEISDEFLVITPQNVAKNAAAAKVLGFTEKTLKTHMTENGMLLLALTGNNTRQIQLREQVAPSDSYAAKIGDLSLLDNENIRESAKALLEQMSLPGQADVQVVSNSNGLKAIRLSAVSDNVLSVQYITVRNGRIYSLVGYDAADADTDYLADIFETLNIEKKGGKFSLAGATGVVTTIIVSLLILVAVIVIIRLIISFVVDFRNRDNDVREFVRIKRRKF